MRRGTRSGFTVAPAAVATVALVAGCTAYELAEIEVFPRPVATAPSECLIVGREDSAPEGGGGLKLTLSSSGGTSRAELGLVSSALEFVGAHARARSVVDGLAHFARDGSGPRVTVRMERARRGCAETWLLDRNWALRRMGCGAMLVWEGELGPVLDRLSIVLRGRDAH